MQCLASGTPPLTEQRMIAQNSRGGGLVKQKYLGFFWLGLGSQEYRVNIGNNSEEDLGT